MKVYKYISLMDKSKQTMPKLSHSIEPLATFLREQQGDFSEEKFLNGGGSCNMSDIGTMRAINELSLNILERVNEEGETPP